MTKKELRKLYLEKRSVLSNEAYATASLALCNYFFASLDLSSVKVIHTFLPIEKNKEPNTFLILDRLQKDFPAIQISVPRVNYNTNTLDNFYFEGMHQLERNSWNILEPKQGVETKAEVIDVVLVPLIVFDLQGHRAGYGKGYYDKFLPACRRDCKKVGISLFDPVNTIDDVDDHDHPLDVCITPTKVYSF